MPTREIQPKTAFYSPLQAVLLKDIDAPGAIFAILTILLKNVYNAFTKLFQYSYNKVYSNNISKYLKVSHVDMVGNDEMVGNVKMVGNIDIVD